MSLLDIILGSLLAYGFYKGLRNGLFVALASFISLILGIYLAVKFSTIIAKTLSQNLHWNPKTIQILAFVLTFILVVVGIYFGAKILTKIASFAYLGWINTIGGGVFSALKTILILGVILNLFDKINFNQTFAKKETLDNSLFYRPFQKISDFMYPSIQNEFEKVTNSQ